MYEISGKTLVFTDCHLGLRNGSTSRLNIVINVFKQMLRTIKANGIENVIFIGDAFHDRKSIDVNVLNVGSKLFTVLSKFAEVYMILGNHDCFYKTKTDVSSVNIFGNNKRIHIISQVEEVLLNNQYALFVPWLGDISTYENETFDLMFGHFDIGVQYLIASYIEEHSKDNMSNEKLVSIISKDELISEKIAETGFDTVSQISEENRTKSSALIGSFIDVVKQGGTIYSGHIHNHREFFTNGRKFIFVGSPYQQTFGEMHSVDGYYVMDETNKETFIKTENIPVHVKLKMSDILNAGIDNYDFSPVRGNIVKRVYDVEVPRLDEIKINQKIQDNQPYEEISADFEIVKKAIEDVDNETLEMMKKSKLDYIMKYIDDMDEKVLAEKNIDKGKLFSMLKDYYEKAEGIA